MNLSAFDGLAHNAALEVWALTHFLGNFTQIPGSAGVQPATSTARCEDLANCSISDVLFALGGHGGRDTRAPSKELRSL